MQPPRGTRGAKRPWQEGFAVLYYFIAKALDACRSLLSSSPSPQTGLHRKTLLSRMAGGDAPAIAWPPAGGLLREKTPCWISQTKFPANGIYSEKTSFRSCFLFAFPREARPICPGSLPFQLFSRTNCCSSHTCFHAFLSFTSTTICGGT